MTTPGSGIRGQAAALAVALAVGVALGAALDAVGRSARVVLPERRVVRVDRTAEVLTALGRAGVRGREILWLDRGLPVSAVPEDAVAEFLRDPSSPPPGGDDSVLYLAMRANLVRRVVYVVPDDRWASYAAAARARPELHPDEGGFVQLVEGVPVLSLPTREALAARREPAVVYATPTTREFFGGRLADELVSDPALSDLVVVRR